MGFAALAHGLSLVGFIQPMGFSPWALAHGPKAHGFSPWALAPGPKPALDSKVCVHFVVIWGERFSHRLGLE